MDDPRIIELLAEMLHRLDRVVDTVGELRKDVQQLRKEQNNTNLAIGELRLSVMQLADELREQKEIKARVSKLEDAVFGRQA